MVTAGEAIAYLGSLCLTPGLMLEALVDTARSIHFFGLFEHYFPREFRRLVKKGVRKSFNERSVLLRDGFITLVGERLFPLPDLFIDEIAQGRWDELSGWVPIVPANDDWWERTVDDLCSLDRAILEGMGLIEEEGEFVEASVPNIDYDFLEKQSRGPLKYLPDAVRVVAHDTSNPWIDMSWEEAGHTCVDWNVSNMDMMAKEWKAARRILERVNRVHLWVHDEAGRCRRVRELVAAAVRQEVRIRVRSR